LGEALGCSVTAVFIKNVPAPYSGVCNKNLKVQLDQQRQELRKKSPMECNPWALEEGEEGIELKGRS